MKKESIPTSSTRQKFVNLKIKLAGQAIKIPLSSIDSAFLLSTITLRGSCLAIQVQHFHPTPFFDFHMLAFFETQTFLLSQNSNKAREIPICSR